MSTHHGLLDAEMQVQVVLPQGIESVNGSSVDMGCTSPLVDSGGVMVCGGCSYLTDGVSPAIYTRTPDWASQLVTVRRNEGTPDLTFPHVLLTFAFDTSMILAGIEMDLFLCPDWNISAPSMYIYLDPDYNLIVDLNGRQFVKPHKSPQSSCNYLSTVTFIGGAFLTGSYRTFHILVDLSVDDSIEWVHVGEVRFLVNLPTCLQPSPTLSPIILSQKLLSSCDSHYHTLTSIPGDGENEFTCSEKSSSLAVIAVSAVSLLLIVTLTTVILTQCLLIIRMRRRSRNKTETYAEVTNPTTNTTDVPVSPNEAYGLTKITRPREEVTYELVK